MIRYLAGYWVSASVVVFFVLAGLAMGVDQETTLGRGVGLILSISVLSGLAWCFVVYELDHHSKAKLAGIIVNQPERRWFWWGMGSGSLNAILVIVTVWGTMLVVRLVPALADKEWIIAFVIGITSVVVYPAVTIGRITVNSSNPETDQA